MSQQTTNKSAQGAEIKTRILVNIGNPVEEKRKKQRQYNATWYKNNKTKAEEANKKYLSKPEARLKLSKSQNKYKSKPEVKERDKLYLSQRQKTLGAKLAQLEANRRYTIKKKLEKLSEKYIDQQKTASTETDK